MRSVLLAVVAAALACSGGANADPADCTAMYPRGSEPIASVAQIDAATSTCAADDGECQASTCTGTAAGRQCEAGSLTVTAQAAVCIAQAHGLRQGLDPPTTELIYNFQARRIIWTVRNVLYDRSRGVIPAGSAGDRGGQIFALDAETGEVVSMGNWSEIS